MTSAASALRDANHPANPLEFNSRMSDFPGFRFLDPGADRKDPK